VLHLSDNYVGAAGALSLAAALRQNRSLVELKARANELGDEGVGAICDALSARVDAPGPSSERESPDGGIRVVDFGNNGLTAAAAAPLARLLAGRTLRELSLYMNELGDAGAATLSKALKGDARLRSLDLGGNGVGPDGARALADALAGNRTLSSLELGYNPIGPSGAAALAGALKHSSRVKTLKLGWCKLGGKPDEGGSVLRVRKQDGSGANAAADLLMYCTSLTTLDLRGNELGPGGAAAVARALRELDSSGASAASSAAAAAGGGGEGKGSEASDGADPSPSSSSPSGGGLEELDLGYNDIKDDGACALAQALKANPSSAPRSLKVNANYLGRMGQVALTEAMDMVAELGGGRDITITF
jgi:Ran GTPase-activating protein (RanGAP) involved in mRNA processing and transport